MTTVATSITRGDDELELCVDGDVELPSGGRTQGPPERCYEPSDGHVEITHVAARNTDPSRQIDGRYWIFSADELTGPEYRAIQAELMAQAVADHEDAAIDAWEASM